ncbi:TPA: hypothetical protein QCK11_003883 [Enterobacter asburiae]|nr:hypothetical protein [Enterobacter asburiae]
MSFAEAVNVRWVTTPWAVSDGDRYGRKNFLASIWANVTFHIIKALLTIAKELQMKPFFKTVQIFLLLPVPEKVLALLFVMAITLPFMVVILCKR